MRDVEGGFDIEEVEVAVDEGDESIVAGKEIEEELGLPESDNFSLLLTHYSVYEVD